MFDWLARQTRRLRTGFPTANTAENHNSWVAEQIAAYATPQPYAAPLTSGSDNWTGETWEMRQGYRRFAFKEPSVKASLLTKCLAVAQLDLVVIPDDNTDKQSRAVAQYVKWAVAKCNGGATRIIQNVLLPGLIDGFSVCEKVPAQVEDMAPKYAGYWRVSDVKDKDTHGIRFRLDKYKNIVAVRSMIAAQGGMEFAPSDFIIFSHLSVFQNPFGLSDLRAANRAANLIEASIKLRAILLENFSGPYLVGKADDATARTTIMAVLSTARARGWIVIPEGASVEVINLATSAPDQFQATIEDLRQEIVTAIQGAYLQLLEGSTPGGRGNTETHKGIAELFVWWLSQCVGSVLNNSLVPDLVYPNFGRGVALPTIQLGNVDPKAIGEELDKFRKGQELGVTLSKKQVSGVGGFETPEDDDDKLVPPAGPGAPVPPPAGGPGGQPPPDLASIFGPPDADPTNDGGDQKPQPAADAAPAFADDGTREFSEEEYAAMSMADRGHLVPKIVQDKNGQHRKVWVNPNKGDHGDEATRLKPRTDATAALTHALENRHTLTPEHVAALPAHLAAMTKDEQKETARKLGLQLSDDKKALTARIMAYVQKKAQPKRPPGPDSLYKQVVLSGGIDPQSHAFKGHFKNVNEAMQNGISLGLFRKGGNGLDALAMELHGDGYIQSPDPEHLLDQLRKGAKGSYTSAEVHHDYWGNEYERRLREEMEWEKDHPESKKERLKLEAREAKLSNKRAKERKPEDDFIPFADAGTPVAELAEAVDELEKSDAELTRARKAAEVLDTLAEAMGRDKVPA